jgi:hypothetical protein
MAEGAVFAEGTDRDAKGGLRRPLGPFVQLGQTQPSPGVRLDDADVQRVGQKPEDPRARARLV